VPVNCPLFPAGLVVGGMVVEGDVAEDEPVEDEPWEGAVVVGEAVGEAVVGEAAVGTSWPPPIFTVPEDLYWRMATRAAAVPAVAIRARRMGL
jgi:hypothetical protein